nr:hypothetical protein [Tanacetum cinerariifolium]
QRGLQPEGVDRQARLRQRRSDADPDLLEQGRRGRLPRQPQRDGDLHPHRRQRPQNRLRRHD